MSGSEDGDEVRAEGSDAGSEQENAEKSEVSEDAGEDKDEESLEHAVEKVDVKDTCENDFDEEGHVEALQAVALFAWEPRERGELEVQKGER
jgi:hypothetical protein